MSPRPRKVEDDDVFMAAQRAMERLGPAELTLAHIAGEAGLTAGALVQRFGSKRGLFLAIMERFAGSSGATFEELRKGHRSPLAVLRAYSDCMAHMAASPAAVSRNFSYFLADLTDPDFRKHLVANAHATRAELQKLIREAIAAKELKPTTNPKQLARTIEVVVGGSMMSWAVYQDGTAEKWMRHDFEAVVKPYLT